MSNIRDCLIEAIKQTEFSGRAINKRVAYDLQDRIKQKTGLFISGETLYNIYRKRISEEEISDSEKNAIAQFANFHSWQDYISIKDENQIQDKKFPIKSITYITTFMIGIYLFIRIIKHILL